MIQLLEQVMKRTVDRLNYQVTTYLPGLLAALLILLAAYVVARFARWLLYKLFKGISFDRFLSQSGLSAILTRSGRLRATQLVSDGVYYLILGAGLLTALSAFDSQLTNRMIEAGVFLFPKLLAAAAILLSAAWLGRYFGRGFLVWAFNEGFPYARRLSQILRIFIFFVGVVVAADYLDFARNVFLAAFVLVVGGAVLAAALAVGLGSRLAVRRCFQERHAKKEEEEDKGIPLWKHL